MATLISINETLHDVDDTNIPASKLTAEVQEKIRLAKAAKVHAASRR
jgi:hypothetical protein